MYSSCHHHASNSAKKYNELEVTGECTIRIRGHSFDYNELINPLLRDTAQQAHWATQLQKGLPYPHLSVTDWFDVDFLRLIAEEFEINNSIEWRVVDTDKVNFRRSIVGEYLGPATELYFSIINSNWFVQLLSRISSIPELIVDHSRIGGGMHETIRGGHFSVHSDFNRHVSNGLANKMVFITYLTPDWKPEWAGELELWDAKRQQCITKVAPSFGQSILMLNGTNHFHGHPSVWSAPAGVSRRSIANYYYVNEYAQFDRSEHYESIYMSPGSADRVVSYIRPLLPPIVWQALRKLLGRP